MKIFFWSIGKAHEPAIKPAIDDFTRRIGRYYPVEWNLISPLKNAATLSPADVKKKEGEILQTQLANGKEHFLVTLDEYGKELTSEGLARFLQGRANDSSRDVVFLIGGVYGLDETILRLTDYRWSLSQLTLPHQLVRLILTEQIYRACTILRNEKYHHA
jgi:23S rRNA (pseudouridine1915-N3)-methyltransferase